MNNVKLLGRLSKNPEMSYSANGKAYTWFTLAVTRKGNRDQADFVRCVAFGKMAESLAQYCKKGRQLLVDGRIEFNTVQDKETQEYKTHVQVVAEHIEFLHDPNANQAA